MIRPARSLPQRCDARATARWRASKLRPRQGWRSIFSRGFCTVSPPGFPAFSTRHGVPIWRSGRARAFGCRPLAQRFASRTTSAPAERYGPAAGGERPRPTRLLRDDAMTTIYVGNLPFSATEDDIRSLFEAHGKVESVKLINDRETGRPRGFGFVDMPSADAQKAIAPRRPPPQQPRSRGPRPTPMTTHWPCHHWPCQQHQVAAHTLNPLSPEPWPGRP